MYEFMWDGCGDDLGSLKNEADDFLKDEERTKGKINWLKDEIGGMIYFDELILGGCKFYTLRKGDRVVAVLYISPKKFIYFLKHPEDPYFRAFR